jgi:hypothetical protein
MVRRESHQVRTFVNASSGELQFSTRSTREIAERMLQRRDPSSCRAFVEYDESEYRCCTTCAALQPADEEDEWRVLEVREDCALRAALVISDINECIERALAGDISDAIARHVKMIH